MILKLNNVRIVYFPELGTSLFEIAQSLLSEPSFWERWRSIRKRATSKLKKSKFWAVRSWAIQRKKSCPKQGAILNIEPSKSAESRDCIPSEYLEPEFLEIEIQFI